MNLCEVARFTNDVERLTAFYRKFLGAKPEVEDLLRQTLVTIANDEFAWDVSVKAKAQPKRSIIDIFENDITDFSKYRLAKAYVRWTRDHSGADLTANERSQWATLIDIINKALK